MSKKSKDFTTISVAVPIMLKNHLDKRIVFEGQENLSDLLRKILIDYIRYNIGAEDFTQIIYEIGKMVARRDKWHVFL